MNVLVNPTKAKENSSEAGFALITVMLVSALVAIIASQLMYQQMLDIQRSQNQLSQSQAMAVANGLSSWVKKGLKLDLTNNQIDHLNEKWAQGMPPVPFAGGQVAGKLTDLQGKFNVNNLGELAKAKRLKWEAIAKRLMVQQSLEESLVSVITDWVDKDNNAKYDGAESDVYLLREPAYRAANQFLVLEEELSLLEGFDAKTREKLHGLVSTLPAITAINVNTAPQGVIQALTAWMTKEIAQAWVKEREESPVDSTDAFRRFMVTQAALTATEVKDDLPDTLITFKTDYFLLEGFVNYGEANHKISAVFFRKDKDTVNIIQKWIGIADDE